MTVTLPAPKGLGKCLNGIWALCRKDYGSLCMHILSLISLLKTCTKLRKTNTFAQARGLRGFWTFSLTISNPSLNPLKFFFFPFSLPFSLLSLLEIYIARLASCSSSGLIPGVSTLHTPPTH